MQALHEAGYDAHITGIVFLRLAHYLTMTAASHPLTAAQVVAQVPICNKMMLIRYHHASSEPCPTPFLVF